MNLVRLNKTALLGLLLTGFFCAGQVVAQENRDEYSVESDIRIEGVWEQGSLLVGKVEPGYDVYLNGEEIYVDLDGLFVFGLSRDAESLATLSVKFRNNLINEFTFDVKQREYDIQSVTGIAQNIMQPSAEDQERIQREAVLVAKARQTFLRDRNFLQVFQPPAEGPLTGVYGSQRIYNGVPGTPHYGIDFAGPTGTPVSAPAAGLVILAEPDLFYSGGTLIIDHGFGVSSTFLHLSALDVKVGQRVNTGDLIGKIGSSGRASGPHLDWRMNWKNVRIDPQIFLDSPDRNPLN